MRSICPAENQVLEPDGLISDKGLYRQFAMGGKPHWPANAD